MRHYRPPKSQGRIIHKPTHITLRIDGATKEILTRRMKLSGLDRTHVICELIKYADRHATGTGKELHQ